jgi:predicted Zn-dependent protease with MMP-like domain
MLDVNEEMFSKLVDEAMESLPPQQIENMQNVSIVISDEPTPEQRERLKLSRHESLYGLYEGVPLTQRGSGYSGVLPDKITIFRIPMLYSCRTLLELKEQIKRTVWHEIAHHYGLDHKRIDELENKSKA